MAQKVDNNVIMKLLNWAYEKSLDGLPGMPSAEELAEKYLDKNYNDPIRAANNLVVWQVRKCTTSGFLSGLGGVLTLPATVPANISSVLYVQMRMIAAIAYIGGYDIRDDAVMTLIYICMAGNSAMDIAKDCGIKIGAKLTQNAIKQLSVEVIKKINQAVGFRLLTKFGEKGIINLGKAVPIVGGIIGGSSDMISTKIVAKVAKNVFLGI